MISEMLQENRAGAAVRWTALRSRSTDRRVVQWTTQEPTEVEQRTGDETQSCA